MKKNRFYRNISILILMMLIFGSCKKESPLSLNGFWESKGYGRILEINDSLVSLYDSCKTGCHLQQQFPREIFDGLFNVENLTEVSFSVKNEITVYEFLRSEDGHELCSDDNAALKNDPVHNFETLWHTFNEQYCYFKEREIDWNAYKAKYGAKINSDTTPLDLYIVLEEMLEEMDDGHVYIGLPESLEAAYEARMEAGEEDNTTENKGESISALRRSIREKTGAYYLEKPRSYNKGNFRWGMISENLAYIQVNSMSGAANYGIPDSLAIEEFAAIYREKASESMNFGEDLRNGTRFIMDSIIPEISSAKACILDLRFNGGGYDIVGLEILNHFTSEDVKAFTKKARFGDGYTKKQPVYLSPSKKQFSGKVYVLTSNETASAAEIMTLSSMALPHAARVGSATEGVFSDILEKVLPIGWTYGLSNEIYESFEGKNYEHLGIPPDHTIDYPTGTRAFYEGLHNAMENGDEAIETVIRLTAENEPM